MSIEEDETRGLAADVQNETHNHPTEIEPFGGAPPASAVRSVTPSRAERRLSGDARHRGGRSRQKLSKLFPGSCRRKLTTKAANGFSSYGNQIGLQRARYMNFIPKYVAKRMEVSAVVGAAREERGEEKALARRRIYS